MSSCKESVVPIRTVLCGIGGYGEWYLSAFWDVAESPIAFVGLVDPFPHRSKFAARLSDGGRTIYPTLEAFYEEERADLAILSSPIACHATQTLCALEHDSHVLCEKPLCAKYGDAIRMRDAGRASGRVVAIGYQESFSATTQRLKADILAGVWGRPKRFKCAAQWPRNRAYYDRNGWAGRIKDASGAWVLDSPLNNALSHYLHHLLYLLGPSTARCAEPLELEAQLYRAHRIENYDTAFVRGRVGCGAEWVFCVSHAGTRQWGPLFDLEFEKGTVRAEFPGGMATGVFHDGRAVEYGPVGRDSAAKVHDVVAAIREGREPLCGVEAAMGQTLCMLAVQRSGAPAADFPPEIVRDVELDGAMYRDVDGLREMLMRAFDSGALPDPSWAAWVRRGRPVRAPEAAKQFE